MASTSPSVLLIRTAGTNCDAELARAFALAGAAPSLVHVDALIRDPSMLARSPIIAIAGGFSYGDDIAAGRVLAVKLRTRLWSPLRDAIERGALMFGVCNGFQVLTQLGLLPGCIAGGWPGPGEGPPRPTVALAENAQGRFVDRWCRMAVDAESPCVWTAGLDGVDAARMVLPIAHGEGRVVGEPAVIERVLGDGLAPLRYASGDNPNGSMGDIAGMCDPSGRIFGLMPHPERYLSWAHHPSATRLGGGAGAGADGGAATPGLRMFQNAVAAAREGVGVG
ncbi:MAG: phosphoribosylformylglycinamidine synthase subunit PurQ [Phycisphaerales bacterium]